MKINHLIAVAALALTATFCACGNADNYPEQMGREVVISGNGIENNSLKLKAGDEVQLTGTIAPKYTEEGDILWSSDNEEVATVSEDGIVTAVNDGVAVITAIEDRHPIYGIGHLTVEVTGGSVAVVDDEPIDQGLADAPRR